SALPGTWAAHHRVDRTSPVPGTVHPWDGADIDVRSNRASTVRAIARACWSLFLSPFTTPSGGSSKQLKARLLKLGLSNKLLSSMTRQRIAVWKSSSGSKGAYAGKPAPVAAAT